MTSSKEFPWCKGDNTHWKTRTQMVANEIQDGWSVIDLGAGRWPLLAYLKNPSRYVAVDAEAWVDGTVLADFNKDQFPELGIFDVIVVQGLLEYLEQPRDFLSRITKYGDRLVITYLAYDPMHPKSAVPRSNHFSLEEFETLLWIAGWRIISVRQLSKYHRVYAAIKC